MHGKLNNFVFSFEEMINQAIANANDKKYNSPWHNDRKRYDDKNIRVYILIRDNYNLIDYLIDYFESKNIGLRIYKDMNELNKYAYIINLDEFDNIIRDDHYMSRGFAFMYFLVYGFCGVKCANRSDIPHVHYRAFDTKDNYDWNTRRDNWYKETKEKK